MTRIVKKPDVRREEIVAAARELFETQDYESTTMGLLMKKLNVAKGTIYHYFASKEDLLEAVVADVVDEDLRKKEQLMNSPEVRSLDALAKLRILVTSKSIAESDPRLLEELHRPGNAIMHTRQLGRQLTMLAPLFAAVIQEGCQQGVFQVEHPLESAEFLLAGIQVITDMGFYPWSGVDLSRRAAALPSLLEAQLRAPRGSFDYLAD